MPSARAVYAACLACASCLVGAAVRADGAPASPPDASGTPGASEVQKPAWSAEHAARLIARHHLRQPLPADLPSRPAALIAFVSGFDPYVEVAPRPRGSSAGERLGVLQITTPDGRLVVPQPGGPAWRSGLERPIMLDPEDGEWPSDARIAGTYLDDGRRVDRIVTRESGPPFDGEVHVRRLGGQVALQLNLFVAGRTVASTRRALAAVHRPETGAASVPPANGADASAGVAILDLRYCAGGDVFEATDFAGLWFDEPRNWTSVDSASRPRLTLTAGSSARDPLGETPRAILVSEFTASACEQLVRGLRHYTDVVVLGERTAGKCTVQSTFPLDTDHEIRFTTGVWTGPDSGACDPDGIEPSRPFEGNVHAEADLENALAGIGRQGFAAEGSDADMVESPERR